MSAVLEHRRRLMGMGGVLPSGYTRLDYITSNGAYINANLQTALPYTYEADVMWASFGSRGLFGANGGNFFGVNNYGYWQNGQATQTNTGVQAVELQWYKVRQEAEATGSGRSNYLYIDGTKICSHNPSYTQNNICIFASSAGSNIASTASCKYFKIWLEGVLVRHFIPCIDPNNIVGMYDLVNDVFYGSANSTNFNGQ